METAVEHWSAAIAGGGDPAEHRFVADLRVVVDDLNARARERMEVMGRLGERLQVDARGGDRDASCDGAAVRELAVGDRVAFANKHVRWEPRIGEGRQALLRRAGAPRMRKVTTPRRTRGEVIAVDVEEQTITVRTDAAGRLPSREVVVTAKEAAGQAPAGLGELEHGYAMTTTTAQGREWQHVYVVLTGSRLMGLEQAYTAQTRSEVATHLYGNADTVHAEDDLANGRTWRDATKDALAESLTRSTAKVTTLDYADPRALAALEAQFATRQGMQPLDRPASEGQRTLLERIGRPVDVRATWFEASVAIDLAMGHVPGTQTAQWLRESGLSDKEAWRRVAAALDEQERRLRLVGELPSAEDRVPVEMDPHLYAIEELLGAPPEERIEAAERYVMRVRQLAEAGVADDGSAPEPVSAETVTARERELERALETCERFLRSARGVAPSVEEPVQGAGEEGRLAGTVAVGVRGDVEAAFLSLEEGLRDPALAPVVGAWLRDLDMEAQVDDDLAVIEERARTVLFDEAVERVQARLDKERPKIGVAASSDTASVLEGTEELGESPEEPPSVLELLEEVNRLLDQQEATAAAEEVGERWDKGPRPIQPERRPDLGPRPGDGGGLRPTGPKRGPRLGL